MGNIVVGFLEDQEIRHHGAEWLEKVASNDDKQLHWKPLNDWTEEFEPKPQKHETQLESAIKSKATQVLMDTLDRRIVARVLRLVLDVTSQVLTLAESKLLPEDAVARILNNVNGILLSYRFQNDDKRLKFEYFRRRATDNLTATLWECLPSENTAAKLLELQQHVEKTLLYLQDKVRPIVAARLGEIFAEVNNQVDQRVNERLGDSKVSLAFEERLMQFDQAANQVTATVENIEVMAEKVAVTADQAVAGMADDTLQENREMLEQTTAAQAEAFEEQVRIQENATVVAVHDKAVKVEEDFLATKDAVLQKKTQVLSNFAEIVKSLIMAKMDQLTLKMVDFMDHLFLAFYEIHLVACVAETKSTNTLQELQDKMHDRVQDLAKHLQEQVEAEVKLVTETIGAMMVHPREKEDEEADKLENESD